MSFKFSRILSMWSWCSWHSYTNQCAYCPKNFVKLFTHDKMIICINSFIRVARTGYQRNSRFITFLYGIHVKSKHSLRLQFKNFWCHQFITLIMLCCVNFRLMYILCYSNIICSFIGSFTCLERKNITKNECKKGTTDHFSIIVIFCRLLCALSISTP